MGKKRLVVLISIFLVLTLVAGMHIYNSFKKILEMPENIPSLNENIPKGFWLNFGMIYYFFPIKAIVLTFGFYSVSLFLVDYFDKKIGEWKRENDSFKQFSVF